MTLSIPFKPVTRETVEAMVFFENKITFNENHQLFISVVMQVLPPPRLECKGINNSRSIQL